MGFHIIIGGPTRKGPFRQLYAGPSGAEGEAAMATAPDAVFGILHNPQIRFKNNARATTDLPIPPADPSVADPSIAEPGEDTPPTEDPSPRRGRRAAA